MGAGIFDSGYWIMWQGPVLIVQIYSNTSMNDSFIVSPSNP